MEYSKHPKCIIKFTINPTADIGFNIKMRYKKRKHLEFQIIGKTNHDIFQLAKELKKEFMIYDNYSTTISYQGCPINIKQSKKLKNNLMKLFTKPIKTESTEATWEIIQNYVDLYGKAPDFDKYYIFKIRKKITNYIEHILNHEINDDVLNNLMEERLRFMGLL